MPSLTASDIAIRGDLNVMLRFIADLPPVL